MLVLRCLVFALAMGAAACGSSDTPTAEEPPPGPPEEMTVLTFNVLCSFCSTPEHDTWDERLVYFEEMLRRHDADLIGLQELAFGFEVDLFQAMLAEPYEAIFYRRDEAFAYPDATILYRASRFEALEHGFYWLSPTPDTASSTGFASPQLPRLVAWARLRDRRSRRELYFASTHFDNNTPSQALSAPLVVERTAPWLERMPALVVGDFNAKPDHEAYTTLTAETFVNTQDLADDWAVDTNQEPAADYPLEDRIDHIFVAPAAPAWTVASWVVDLHVYGENDRHASDHRLMFARLTAPEHP